MSRSLYGITRAAESVRAMPARARARTGTGGARRFACLAAGVLLAAGMVTRAYGVHATGGTVTNYALGGTNFIAHIFTTVGSTNFTVMIGGDVEVLVVGGGGGGGKQVGGGGGAGGFQRRPTFPILPGTSVVIVGDGGSGASVETPGTRGADSVFSNGSVFVVARGGGGGGSYPGHAPTAGGSGGGGGGNAAPGAAGTDGQGRKGGVAYDGNWAGGGGGGAGGPGVNATAGFGGAGGVGRESSMSGTATHYAGGGGGCSEGDNAGSNGGLGGGGKGRSNTENPPQDGSPNTGGGGGGRRDAGSAGKGGSGIVIVRYAAFNARNHLASDVTTTSATLNGRLGGTGGSPASVCVMWGEKNGGNTWDWAKTEWFDGDQSTDNTPFSKKIAGLGKNKTYYYTFGAKNVGGETIAAVPVSFITGEVTVKVTATKAWEKGEDGVPVPATVTVSRPAACADAALTVAYRVAGTAGNGTDYTSLNESVTLLAGAVSADIVIAPWNDLLVEDDETVTIALLPGPYVVGAASALTVTVIDTVVRSYYVAPHATATAPYDTWAKGFSNLQTAFDHAAAKGDAVIYLAGGRPLTGPALGATHPDNTVFRLRGANNVMLRGGYRADTKLPPADHPGPRTAGPTILRRSTADPVRVLTLSEVTNAVIERVTIRDGLPGGRRGLGGGVFLSGCRNVVFKDCRVVCNTNAHSSVGLGGGMYLADSHVTLTDTTIATNAVVGPDSYGGGIYVHRDSRVSMTRSAIQANETATSDGHIAKAGGYYVVSGGILELNQSVVEGNSP